MPVQGMSAGGSTDMILPGSYVRDDAWAWSVGDILYASTVTGNITTIPPSGTGDVVQVIGHAVTPDIIYFNPSPDWFEVG